MTNRVSLNTLMNVAHMQKINLKDQCLKRILRSYKIKY